MTREDFLAIFKGNEKNNFCIYTNIAQGRGINGVSFNTIEGEVVYRSEANLCYYRKINHIAKCLDNYFVIEHYVSLEDSRVTNSDKSKTYYIPYEVVNMIEFNHTDNRHTPLKLTKKTIL